MRAKCPPCFLVALALIVLGSFVTDAVAERPPRPGELEPVVDPTAEPFAVTGTFLPGPVDAPFELPSVPTPQSQQQSLFNAIPAASDTGAGALDPMGSLGGAILSTRSGGGGAGVSGLQDAKRRMKQLIRQLG